MAGIETTILEALLSRLSSLVLSPAMLVAWPGQDLAPAGAAYLRGNLLPSQTQQTTLGDSGMNRHLGVFQVDVFWPAGLGITDAYERASSIISWFKRGTVIVRNTVTVRVIKPPYASPYQQEPGWLQIPVNIPYQADTSNP